jgi:hypothetical protein
MLCTVQNEWNSVNIFSRDFPFQFPLINLQLSLVCTRWFKYDRDKLWLVYTQIVPVIFEPPCIWLTKAAGIGLDSPGSITCSIAGLFFYVVIYRLLSGPPSLHHNSLVWKLTAKTQRVLTTLLYAGSPAYFSQHSDYDRGWSGDESG